ncbi:MAG: sigma-70 family RNA polymerase sigma factor [Myxococcales bacterium]|nr:sigma-70 family RNA polymerase sigma factor [Myxococcales bacterium]
MTEGTKYEIGRKLGQGGMAETFEAMRGGANGHGFRVALKHVLPELLGRSKDKEKEFLQRFSQEAQIGAKLEHPNIVRVVDTGILGGRPYLAMELVDGVSLARLIKVCRRNDTLLPSFVVLHIACDVAAALEYAHRHEVVHRDVTPGNVLLSKTGECKLSDFGIARVLSDDLALTRTSAFMGKFPYVAPEVFNGNADASSDLYSLGVTVTEAAIGKTLFPSPTAQEAMAVRSRTDVAELVRASRDDLPNEFADMMGRLTAHDRNRRPKVDEVLDVLEDMVGCSTSAAEQELSKWVAEALAPSEERSRPGEIERGDPIVRGDKTRTPQLALHSTASVMFEQEELVRGVLKRMTVGMDLSTDARAECLAEGRLGLLEAHREFDRKHRSGAKFVTFAFPRVHRKVQEAVEALGGVPRGVYRAAKKNAAIAREQAGAAEEVHTEEHAADRMVQGADELHIDPFTAIGDRLEKNAVRAAIERLPDAQQREVLRLIYMEGLSQVDVGRIIKRDRPRVFRIHQAGIETVQKLLLLGTALEKERVEQSVGHLAKRRQRDVLLALYRDRLDYRSARLKFGVNAEELNELHQAALDALIQHNRS